MSLGGTRVLDQDLDLGGVRVHNPRAPIASDDLVRLSDVAALAPSVDMYALVTRSDSAPHNALDLSSLGTGVLQQAVSGSVATLSSFAISPTNIPFGSGSGGLAQSNNFTYNSFLFQLDVPKVNVNSLLRLPYLTGTGLLGFDNATKNVFVDLTHYLAQGNAWDHISDGTNTYGAYGYNATLAFDPATLSITLNGGVDATVGLANTAVTPGSYTNANITVDSKGRITAASNGSAGGGGTITALTGDVTASGSGSVAATIAAGAVTYAKIQGVANNRVLGNVSGSAHAPMELTASDLSALLGLATIATTGSATNLTTGTVPAARLGAFTGDATSAGGTYALTLANSGVAAGSYSYPLITVDAKGRVTAASDGWSALLAAFAPADGRYIVQQAHISLPNAQVLASLGTGLIKNTTTTGVLSIATAGVEYLSPANNLSDVASASTARTNLGLVAIASSGSASDLTTGTLPAGRFPALTGDVTTTAGSLAATIANNAVTFAKMQTIADQRLVGNVSGGTAVPSALTASQVSTFLGLASTYQPILSLTSGSVMFSGGGSTVSQDAGNLFWDATNHVLGIGTNTPNTSALLHATKNANAIVSGAFFTNPSTGGSAGVSFRLGLDPTNFAFGSNVSLNILGSGFTTSGSLTAGSSLLEHNSIAGSKLIISGYSSDIVFTTNTSRTERMRITTGGTVSIAGLTSNGFVKTSGGTGALSVDTTSYQPALTLAAGAVAYGASTTNTATDANNFFYDATNHRLVLGKGGAYSAAAGPPLTVSSNGGSTDSWGTSIAFDKASTDQGITKSGGGSLYLATKGSSSSGIGFITNGASRMFLDGSAGTLSTMSVVPSSDMTYSLGASGAAWDAIWVDTIAKAGVPGTISMASTGPQIDSSATGSVVISHQSTNGRFLSDATGIQFFPTLGVGTTGVAKQAITGSRGGNAALASLLTKLASYGLIVDSTT